MLVDAQGGTGRKATRCQQAAISIAMPASRDVWTDMAGSKAELGIEGIGLKGLGCLSTLLGRRRAAR